MAGISPPPAITIRTVWAQMTTERQSSKLTLEYRGGKIQFGLQKTTGQYRKKHKGKTLYLGSDPKRVSSQWLQKTTQHDEERLSEEELALFDILTKPNFDIMDKEKVEVKKVSSMLLQTLKEAQLVLDWRKKQRTRADVYTTVKTVLDELPRDYTTEI